MCNKEESSSSPRWIRTKEVHYVYSSSYTSIGSHKTPCQHLRRGHHRRVPIGKRGNGQYKIVEILPTIVNKHKLNEA